MSEHEASPGASSAPFHWRVRACHWLWRVLRYVWRTLIVGIVIGTIISLITTTIGTQFSALLIIHLLLTYPLLIGSGLGILAMLTLLSWLGSREMRAILARSPSEQNRVYMLGRLHMSYEQLLSQSLQGAARLELGLTQRPTANIQDALSLALHLPNQPEQPLPPHTSIVQVYEKAKQELLFLGEPGAGKSTLLVELACSLVEQAEQDATKPLPILLPLATWAERKRPLDEWLSEEIARLYHVPRRLSQQWIQAEQVLPLLDGLDEMEEAARPACITVINTYHREHLHPLVVCSRTNEYATATRHDQLELQTSVVVQPLERGQVDVYLANLGKPLAGLRAALKTNVLLRELTTTPLMLQVLILTYRGTSVRALSQKEAQLREQIWTDFVQRMVLSRGHAKRYPFSDTIGWLGWLAYEMRTHNQTIFSLESFQPNWLLTRQRNLYRWSSKLVFGLSIGLPAGLAFGLAFGLLAGLAFGLRGLVGELAGGLAGGLVFGLFGGLFVKLDTEIKPAEILTWSWEKFRSGLGSGLVGGLAGGLVGRLILGLEGRLHGLLAGPVGWLFFGLGGGLVVGLFAGLRDGFSGKQLTERLTLSPNEGIHRSLKNGLLLFAGWLVAGLVVGLVIGLGIGPGAGQLIGLPNNQLTGLEAGQFIGLSIVLIGFQLGGLGTELGAVVQHYTLRFWLARGDIFPWQAVPFLEDATVRILLQRVGGGYSFVHRLLLDFFADLYAGASSALPTAQSAQPLPP